MISTLVVNTDGQKKEYGTDRNVVDKTCYIKHTLCEILESRPHREAVKNETNPVYINETVHIRNEEE